MQRREMLKMMAALPAAGLPLDAVLAAAALPVVPGKSEPFDYARLKGRARALSQAPHGALDETIPESVARLDWDQYQAIRYRDEHALWAKEGLRFQIKFFHLGLFFRTPVHIHVVEGGRAREIAYDAAMFDYGKSGLQREHFPVDLGFAGFRIHYHTDPARDLAVFLGASYFRAVGEEKQYGLSARGLAVDTGLARAEEFPVFRAFWIERPPRNASTLIVYALLDSPSVSGAYRFLIQPGKNMVMDVDAALYPRKAIERLGIAPLTSMYQHGENDRRMANDWRPEIHDSDGLALWTGAGERIWRPLVNPETLRFNAYADENPRGFGLLQRDRNFDHYQDDGVFYDRRPSLWVEPKSGWGKGSVQLVEIPTVDETFDNIVAFWNPAEKPQPGQELLFAYRLHWGATMPHASPLAHVAATRTGIGGVIGRKREYYSVRFAVDFAGGGLAALGKKAKVEPVIVASRGDIEITSARPLDAIQGYRAMFDLKPVDDSVEPVNLRLYLRSGGRTLSETWLYQWMPPPPSQRRF
ncbi:MAG: glucan biosynthesis protein D [Burkholderiales bacterium]|nr:glucan biosynthesis protein D [Burkholderiales bacterium]MCW5605071.1 glucan biosynthesis protein D [Burkholderiales bacterium]